MKAVLQRVSKVRVTGENGKSCQIGNGLLVLLGVEIEDTMDDTDTLLDKIINLRIFEDANGKMNLSLLDIKGGLMIVSQFTLLADVKKGRRPSFHLAGNPEKSKELFSRFVEAGRTKISKVESGWFGEKMQIELINDGPVTVIMESK